MILYCWTSVSLYKILNENFNLEFIEMYFFDVIIYFNKFENLTNFLVGLKINRNALSIVYFGNTTVIFNVYYVNNNKIKFKKNKYIT